MVFTNFDCGVTKRWNQLSESMKNFAFVNYFKNKLCIRMHSIITFTFRGMGVYQNAYLLLLQNFQKCTNLPRSMPQKSFKTLCKKRE